MKIGAVVLLLSVWMVGLASQAFGDDKNVILREVRRGDVFYVEAQLVNCRDVTITITSTGEMQNVTASVPLPLTVEPTKKTQVLVSFTIRDPSKPWTYSWRYHWKYGHRLKRQPDPYLYSLPYQGGPFPVLQEPHGRFSHGPGSQDEDATDWKMPVGTRVCAARAGTVVAFREDCREGGRDLKWKPDFNYIIIKHEDGTYAEYAHLQYKGVMVRLGDCVRVGQEIGLSGNTGYTTEPHLHFTVFCTVDGNLRKTLPSSFKPSD